MNKVILFNSRPEGKPTPDNFKIIEEEMPSANEGQVLLKTLYVSVDPYLRGRMTTAKSYIPPFELNKPLQSAIVAEVVDSKNDQFEKGDFITGNLEWKQFQVSNGSGLNKVDAGAAELSAYLGVLGMTGLTAYFGLTEIAQPKAGETVVISGAAGAVGSIAGQIAKLLGCMVIGIAGTEEKLTLLKTKFGFDAATNYKTTEDMKQAIADAAPDGVDIYFDNVGGKISDAVLANINKFGRVPLCGSISNYNDTEVEFGPRIQSILVKNSVLMQGFIVSNYSSKFKDGVAQLSKWLQEGKLDYSETVLNGFEQIPQAFIDLFEGKNSGKMIVKI